MSQKTKSCLSVCLLISPPAPCTHLRDQSLHASPKGHFLKAPLQALFPKPKRGRHTPFGHSNIWMGGVTPTMSPRMPVRAGHVTPSSPRKTGAGCPCSSLSLVAQAVPHFSQGQGELGRWRRGAIETHKFYSIGRFIQIHSFIHSSTYLWSTLWQTAH